MNKAEFINCYGDDAYRKKEEHTRMWRKAHREKMCEFSKKWRLANPKKLREVRDERSKHGGRGYDKTLKYNRTGLRGRRARIRGIHGHKWRQYKKIIAQGSQLHHQWRLGSAGYDGVALVETNQHQHGIIDVILILEGRVTLLTEAEVRERKK